MLARNCFSDGMCDLNSEENALTCQGVALLFLFFLSFCFFCCQGLCTKHSLCQESSADITSVKPSLTIQQMLLSFITSFGILYFYSLYHGGIVHLFTCILLSPSGQGMIAYVWSLHLAWPAAGIPPNIFNWMNELRVRCTMTSLWSFVSSMLLLMSFSLHGTIFLLL